MNGEADNDIEGDGEICRQVDAYLNGVLSCAASDRFEAHLDGCERCRQIVPQQRWIDDLLRSRDALLAETPPTAVRAALDAAVMRNQRARWAARAVAGVAAAAAIVLMAIGAGRDPANSGDEPPPKDLAGRAETAHGVKVDAGAESGPTTNPGLAASPPQPDIDDSLAGNDAPMASTDSGKGPTPEIWRPADKPIATFVGDSDMIAVPLASEAPDVTIVQLYSTTDAQRRGRLAALLSSNRLGD